MYRVNDNSGPKDLGMYFVSYIFEFFRCNYYLQPWVLSGLVVCTHTRIIDKNRLSLQKGSLLCTV